MPACPIALIHSYLQRLRQFVTVGHSSCSLKQQQLIAFLSSSPFAPDLFPAHQQPSSLNSELTTAQNGNEDAAAEPERSLQVGQAGSNRSCGRSGSHDPQVRSIQLLLQPRASRLPVARGRDSSSSVRETAAVAAVTNSNCTGRQQEHTRQAPAIPFGRIQQHRRPQLLVQAGWLCAAGLRVQLRNAVDTDLRSGCMRNTRQHGSAD